MKKNDFLQPMIENVLINIDFINRYEFLALTYSNRDEVFHFSKNDVLNIAHSIGCQLKYSKSREFYLCEKKGNFSFEFGFTLRYHSLELGCSVKNEYLQIHSAAPWGFWVDLMTNNKKNVFHPKFSNYEELKEILKVAFEIYEDFKREVVKIFGE